MTEVELKKYLIDYLKLHYTIVKVGDGFILAQGELPIALAAHLDTVTELLDKKPPEEIFYDSEAQVMWSPDGLGADDRAGVFAIICLIDRFLPAEADDN